MFSISPSGARLTLPEDGIVEGTHVAKYNARVNMEFDFYTTDASRAWAMKDTTPELSQLKGRLYRGQRRMIAVTGPGLPVCRLFRTTYEYIREQYPCYRRGHYGHGISLGPATAEEPHINAPTERLLEPDAVLAMEIPCYMRGVNGFNIEDVVLITEDGGEALIPKTPYYLQGTSHSKTIQNRRPGSQS